MNRPPGRTTSTSNGGCGSGFQVKRPSASVNATPGRPRIETSAYAMGLPDVRSMTMPSSAAAGDAATATRSATNPVIRGMNA